MASTTPTGFDPKTDPTPLPLTHRIGLGVGFASLVTGCYLGVAMPQARTAFLILLTTSVVAFTVTLVLTVLQQRLTARHLSLPEPKPHATPAPPTSSSLMLTSALPLVARPSPPALAATAPAPKIPAPAPAGAAISRDAAVQAAPPLDVASLMQAPLANLLLAALLKNPEETRRLFGQADWTDPRRISDPNGA